MTRTVRFLLFVVGGGLLAVLFAYALVDMPAFGRTSHPYRDHAVAASVHHASANVISSVNFDQRGLDTLGEETILFASVVGAATLLRPTREEVERRPTSRGRVLEATKLGGYVVLPVTLLLGVNLVVHGHLTPGGGFQGGVVLATGLHLLYLAGRYRALERARPEVLYELGETAAVAGFAGMGFAGIAVAGAFLADTLPNGTFGQLLSAGTVPVLNVLVGIAVGCGVVVLLAGFFAQAITVTSDTDAAA